MKGGTEGRKGGKEEKKTRKEWKKRSDHVEEELFGEMKEGEVCREGGREGGKEERKGDEAGKMIRARERRE